MKHLDRFETDHETALRKAAQIRTLIVKLSRSVQIFDGDIETEQERARVHDISDPAYPILARSWTARRDNLLVTIADLKKRLETIEATVSESA